ncbi:MAG: SIS domain-containing protein [Elusimicrobiota bacterium]
MKKWIDGFIGEHINIVRRLGSKKISKIITMVKKAMEQDSRIFIIGNGGDAACSSHLAVDLGKGASEGKKKRFKVFSPVDNTPWVTAIANDFSYDEIFVRQIENYCQPGDLIIAFSVSGNSPNVVKAVQRGKELGLRTVAITGDRNGKIIGLSDESLIISSKHFGHVEDVQTLVSHIIAYYFIEKCK